MCGNGRFPAPIPNLVDKYAKGYENRLLLLVGFDKNIQQSIDQVVQNRPIITIVDYL